MESQLESLARSRMKGVFRIFGRRCSSLTTWHLLAFEALGIMSVLGPRPSAQDLRLAVLVVSTPPAKLERAITLTWWRLLWCVVTTWTSPPRVVMRKWKAFLEQNRNFPKMRPALDSEGKLLTQPGLLMRIARMIALSPGIDEDTLWTRPIDELAWSMHATAEASGQRVSFYTPEDEEIEAAAKAAPQPGKSAVEEYLRYQAARRAAGASPAAGERGGE